MFIIITTTKSLVHLPEKGFVLLQLDWAGTKVSLIPLKVIFSNVCSKLPQSTANYLKPSIQPIKQPVQPVH